MTPSGRLVGAGEAGVTLAAFVRALSPESSWSQAKELCRGGRVLVDGVAETDPARRLIAGDRVSIADQPQRPPESLLVAWDADLVVVAKPAGVLTVPFERDDRDTLLSLARVAVRREEARHRKAPSPTLRAVQRLDKETSGLVVFARTVDAQRELQRQLGAHTVERVYRAIVHGKAENASYDTWLVPDRGDGLKGSVAPEATIPTEARRAITHVTVAERLKKATLLDCRLETGRQHQIRIHLAEAGHPLVGETVYLRDFKGRPIAAPRPMLHAAVLGFVHPRTGESLRYILEPPEDFRAVLERLR
jgi:23S rRNA pseudouridine1911/1915/1917 synthase